MLKLLSPVENLWQRWPSFRGAARKVELWNGWLPEDYYSQVSATRQDNQRYAGVRCQVPCVRWTLFYMLGGFWFYSVGQFNTIMQLRFFLFSTISSNKVFVISMTIMYNCLKYDDFKKP